MYYIYSEYKHDILLISNSIQYLYVQWNHPIKTSLVPRLFHLQFLIAGRSIFAYCKQSKTGGGKAWEFK